RDEPAPQGKESVPQPAQAAPVAEAAPGADAGVSGDAADLESRWRELGEALATFTNPGDIQRAGDALKQQMQAYAALGVELDRADPAGAPRRRAESVPLLERLNAGLKGR